MKIFSKKRTVITLSWPEIVYSVREILKKSNITVPDNADIEVVKIERRASGGSCTSLAAGPHDIIINLSWSEGIIDHEKALEATEKR